MSSLNMLSALLSAVAMIGLLLIPAGANTNRKSRQQQFLLPGFALLYAVMALLVLYRFNGWLDRFLDRVFGLIPLVRNFYTPGSTYGFQNVTIVLVFAIMKLVLVAISRHYFNGSRFFGSMLVQEFYEFDAPAGRWFLQRRWAETRKLLKVLTWTSIGATALYIFVLKIAPTWPGFAVIAFPAVAAIVVAEVFYALDGLTFEEAKSTLAGERDDAQRIANYAQLRQVFTEALDDRILDQGVDLSGPTALSSHQAISELLGSDEQRQRVYGQFFERLKQSGTAVDENLMHASIGLMDGKSTLINNPFYRDLTPYLTFPAYVALLLSNKVLIVVGRDSAAEDMMEWVEEGLQEISGVPDLWNLGILSRSTSSDLDVAILRTSDLHDLELLKKNDEFLRDVGYVIVAEPSRVLATGQLGMGLVVSRCTRNSPATFVAFDHNHDGLVDALSHVFRTHLTDVVATQVGLGATSDIVWRAEGKGLNDRLIPGVARYLGVGTELGVLALKYHVSEVEWTGGAKFPVTDMNWIAAQYYEKISAFAEMEPSQRALTTALIPRPNPTSLVQRPRRFLIAEDEFSNVYETLRMFSTRSTESGFVNVISEDYLLRDYMTDNREVFSADPKAIPSLTPDAASTERNCVLRLLLELSAFGLSEDDARAALEPFGDAIPPTETDLPAREPSPLELRLADLTYDYTGVALPRLERKRVYGPEGDQVDFAYTLKVTNALEPVVIELAPAFFVAEDGAHKKHVVGACLQTHVPQTVLPGQFLTYDGKYYEVTGLGDGRDSDVRLRRAADHIDGRPAYRPLRSFQLSNVQNAHSRPVAAGEGDVKVRALTADVKAWTHGYLQQETMSQVKGARRIAVDDIPVRAYAKKDILRMELPGASSEVLQTVALLLNEVMVTLFPLGHQFITATTLERAEELGDLLPTVVGVDGEGAKTPSPSIYIIEDSLVDLGLTVAFERNWVRIMDTVADYLDWNATPPEVSDQYVAEVVRFEGDTEESLNERAARIAQAEADGKFLVEKKPWWKRAWEALRRKLSMGRRKDEGVESTDTPDTPEEGPEDNDDAK